MGRKRKAPTAVQGSGSAKRVGFEASAELAGSDLDNLPDPALLEFEDATKGMLSYLASSLRNSKYDCSLFGIINKVA